jgi:integrase
MYSIRSASTGVSASSAAALSQPGVAAAPPRRLLDQLREQLRYLHYSLRTEEAYVHWVRAFVRWSGMRHPRQMGAAEVQAFLAWLATERQVSVSTHRQALAALLFLYQKVFGLQLPWMQALDRPQRKPRLPVVLSVAEVRAVLALLDGTHAVLGQLLYGTGMRITEALQLRTKDVDFERAVIVVRDGKAGKDRVVMPPSSLAPSLKAQLRRAHGLWLADARAGRGGITCTTRPFSVTSNAPCRPPASCARLPRTRCAMPSPRTCFRRAPTYARCRSCWATAMSARR